MSRTKHISVLLTQDDTNRLQAGFAKIEPKYDSLICEKIVSVSNHLFYVHFLSEMVFNENEIYKAFHIRFG